MYFSSFYQSEGVPERSKKSLSALVGGCAVRKSCSCCSCSRSPATHPRPTRDSPGGALAERLSRMGLSRTSSRGRALRLTRDPPATHPEGLSWRGYRGRALAEESCGGLSRMGLSRTGSRGRARKKTTALPTPRLPHPLTLIGKCRVIGTILHCIVLNKLKLRPSGLEP